MNTEEQLKALDVVIAGITKANTPTPEPCTKLGKVKQLLETPKPRVMGSMADLAKAFQAIRDHIEQCASLNP